MMGVRLFLPVLLCESGRFADSLLEFVLRLPQVMEQSSQFSMVLALKVRRDPFRPARHADEMFYERLIWVCEELIGIHGLVNLRGELAVG